MIHYKGLKQSTTVARELEFQHKKKKKKKKKTQNTRGIKYDNRLVATVSSQWSNYRYVEVVKLILIYVLREWIAIKI